MSDNQKRFGELFPDTFFLNKEEPELLAEFLKSNGWIAPDEKVIRLEKPGEGNMNYVLRVVTGRQSFIVKQSRPWVEKYPQIDAPVERIIVEAQFYDALAELPVVQSFIPALKGFKAHSFMMAVEDLGESSDFTSIYKKGEVLSPAELQELIRFVSELHRVNVGMLREPFPANQSLKELNAEHIFTYPYMLENGFDLNTVQEGLQELALTYKKDEALKSKVKVLSEVYLGQGDILIHGDYYPGSWLRTAKGTKVIDPEFAFVGHAEFDLGVMVAHLKMAGSEESLITAGLQQYVLPKRFDHALFAGFCGAEILRRIIGLAQLPLDLSLAEKAELLSWAADCIKQPAMNTYLQPRSTSSSENLIDKS